MTPSQRKGGIPPCLHGKNHHRTLCNKVPAGSPALGGTGPIHPSFPGLRGLTMPSSILFGLANSMSSATSNLDAHGTPGFGSSLSMNLTGSMSAWHCGSIWFSNKSSSYSLTASTYWGVSSSRCTSGLTPTLPLQAGVTLRLVSLLEITLRPVCLVTLLHLLRLSLEGVGAEISPGRVSARVYSPW